MNSDFVGRTMKNTNQMIGCYPTNFVPCGGTLYYIDYECNAYMEQWDFEHWGIQYWTAQAPEKTEKL